MERRLDNSYYISVKLPDFDNYTYGINYDRMFLRKYILKFWG